jgi:predicted RNA-binding Zn-ribbon protein involved in translation (DUF1610 family)
MKVLCVFGLHDYAPTRVEDKSGRIWRCEKCGHSRWIDWPADPCERVAAAVAWSQRHDHQPTTFWLCPECGAHRLPVLGELEHTDKCPRPEVVVLVPVWNSL